MPPPSWNIFESIKARVEAAFDNVNRRAAAAWKGPYLKVCTLRAGLNTTDKACSMASFSRGFSGFLHHQPFRLPSSIRIALFSARSQFAQPRTCLRIQATPFPRHYVKASLRLRPSYQSSLPSVPSYLVRDATVRKVLSLRQPVLLYKAPDRRVYMVFVYALACSTIAAGLYTLKFRSTLSDDLPFFVGPTYVVVAMILFGIGSYIFTAPVSRCTSVELIPKAVDLGVQFRIKARTLPMLRDRIIHADLGDVVIREKTQPVTLELREADRARNQSLRDGLEDMFIVQRGWELAARWMEQKWTSFFLRFKFAVLRFGIVPMTVEGSKWKLDCSGYLLDDGQGTFSLRPADILS